MSFPVPRWILLAGALALAGCGGSNPETHDAAQADASDDPPNDAAPPTVSPTRVELSGGARMTGGTLVIDVQLGHPTSQAPTTGGATVVDPATAIKP